MDNITKDDKFKQVQIIVNRCIKYLKMKLIKKIMIQMLRLIIKNFLQKIQNQFCLKMEKNKNGYIKRFVSKILVF